MTDWFTYDPAVIAKVAAAPIVWMLSVTMLSVPDARAAIDHAPTVKSLILEIDCGAKKAVSKDFKILFISIYFQICF